MSSSDDNAGCVSAGARRPNGGCSDVVVVSGGGGVKKKKKKKRVCWLCLGDKMPDFSGDQEQLVAMWQVGPDAAGRDILAHHFCLLFSSGLGQRGEEREGLVGFLAGDVRRELKRGSRLKCVYCKKKGATVGCAKPQCKKSYHLPCGMANHSLQQFFDQFKSFCSSHRPLQKIKPPPDATSGTVDCGVCGQPVAFRNKTCRFLWTPCCGSLFHWSCLQSGAIEACNQYRRFRCPRCGDHQRFLAEIQQFGVYLPQKDVLLSDHVPSTLPPSPATSSSPGRWLCSARFCFCDRHEQRQFQAHEAGDMPTWTIMPCYVCHNAGIHARCGGLDEYVDPRWFCYTCRRFERTRSLKEQEDYHVRPIREIWGTARAKKLRLTANTNNSDQEEEEQEEQEVAPAAIESGCDRRPAVEKKPEAAVQRIGLSSDLMSMTLEQIIVKGLDEKLRDTNYKSHLMMQTEHLLPPDLQLRMVRPPQPLPPYRLPPPPVPVSHPKVLPPPDSSAASQPQSSFLPVLPRGVVITKAGLEPRMPVGGSGAGANGSVGHEKRLRLSQSDFFDQKIQKSIQDFFRETSSP